VFDDRVRWRRLSVQNGSIIVGSLVNVLSQNAYRGCHGATGSGQLGPARFAAPAEGLFLVRRTLYVKSTKRAVRDLKHDRQYRGEHGQRFVSLSSRAARCKN